MADQNRWTEDRDRGGRSGSEDRSRRGYDEFGPRGDRDREEGRTFGGSDAGAYGAGYGIGGYGEGGYGRENDRSAGGYGQSDYGQADYRQSGRSRSSGEGRYGGTWGQSPAGEGGQAYGGQQSYGGEVYGAGQGRYGAGSQEFGGRSYGQERGQGRPAGGEHERTWMERTGEKIASWFAGGSDTTHHRGRGPKNYTRSDDRIREDVNDRLTDDPWVDATEIEVQVSTCEVTLTGTVNSREEKRRAEDLAEQVSGVRHVQNNLRVQQAGQTTFGSTTGAAATTAGSGRTTGSNGGIAGEAPSASGRGATRTS